jgi:CheY-like chemotaxis protein
LQALELAGRSGEQLDLLATDVIMPQMSGPELYDRLQENHPGLPVLYISGYSDSVLQEEGRSLHEEAFLAKPFTLEQFMERIGGMLGAGADAAPKDVAA